MLGNQQTTCVFLLKLFVILQCTSLLYLPALTFPSPNFFCVPLAHAHPGSEILDGA